MILTELLDMYVEAEAVELFIAEAAEASKSLEAEVAKLPAFPGTHLRRTIEELVSRAASELKIFAQAAKPWAAKRGYRTKIFDAILDNPEKVAKTLIRKYVTAQKADPRLFSVKNLLNGVSLDLDPKD